MALSPEKRREIENIATECAQGASIMMAAMLSQELPANSGAQAHFTNTQAFELTKLFLKLALDEAGLTT